MLNCAVFVLGKYTTGKASQSMSQLPGSPAYLWAAGAEGNGVDAMYASINEFLSTNPTPAQIAAAKADFGVSDADIATATGRTVTTQALPVAGTVVSTAQGSITIDPNSEIARFLQWQGSQPSPTGGTIGDTWARQGIPNPYSDPGLVAAAQSTIDQANSRTALFNQVGQTPPGSIALWNDPDWPAYIGTNREAYNLGIAALNDANIRNNLIAQNGWSQADFASWVLRSTNPDEAARQARISDAAAGLVAGPGTSTTGLSVNGATIVTTDSSRVDSAGFDTASFVQTATSTTATSIAQIVDDYFNTGTTGEFTSFAGGTLYRTTSTDAVFTTATGQAFQINQLTTETDLLAIPGFQAAFAATIGVVQQTGPNVLTNAAGQVTGVVNSATGAIEAVAGGQGGLAVPQIPVSLAGIAAGFAAGFTAELPTLSNIEGALRLTAAQVAGLAQQAESAAESLIAGIRSLPERIPDDLTGFVTDTANNLIQATGLGAVADLLSRQNATIQKAKAQATLEARNNEAAAPDWRVRLSLAPGAQYLYKDPEPGILEPLFDTDGVIFPYTPAIETSYVANYDKSELVHSNYRGYFYKNSAVNDINIRGIFTAQDTTEANYMLAVIHFFRSVTRMFYGQDALRGAPPPLVYLSGFGDYQFNDHPCLVSNFSYSLPDSVDYIRAMAPNNYGNLFSQRTKTGGISTNPLSAALSRLTAAGVPKGAEPSAPSPSAISQNVNNITEATYVPTKIEINITLLPTNTRSQVSQQFSVKEFANGSLLKGGFW